MSVFIHHYNQLLPTRFITQEVSVLKKIAFKSGELELDKSNQFYPNRSDEKIMRTDVIASILVINQMLSEIKENVAREDFSLFVASGVFIEKIENHTRHLVKVYEELTASTPRNEMLYKVYRGSPPLLALQTLTNSVMSFIAQYTGIKGNNTTFGTTSVSGFHAISEGYKSAFFDKEISVVAAANGAGTHSFLMNMPFYSNHIDWFESASVGSLLLSNESANALCKISEIHYKHPTESLSEKSLKDVYNKYESSNSDAVIISGAFTKSENEIDILTCSKNWSEVFSNFEHHGNTGSCNAINSIISGIKLIQKGYKKVDILDKDVYGVESFMQIESVK